MQQGFGKGGCICQNRYVISAVGVGNCFCWVPSAPFLCQLEAVFFDFIDRCSKHVFYTEDKEVWGKCVSLQCSSYNVSPSREHTFTLVFLWRIIMAATVSFGRRYASRICSIFPPWMESKAFVKLTNNIVACRFFARTPSRILRVVNICEVVDRFLREPFLFFLKMLSILGSIWLRIRALYILAAMDVIVIPREFLANPRSPFFGKEDASLRPSVY